MGKSRFFKKLPNPEMLKFFNPQTRMKYLLLQRSVAFKRGQKLFEFALP